MIDAGQAVVDEGNHRQMAMFPPRPLIIVMVSERGVGMYLTSLCWAKEVGANVNSSVAMALPIILRIGKGCMLTSG